MAGLYQVDLPPQILARGFWLYIWKIIDPRGSAFCYVGMTGDVSGVAQSPFARAGGHFSENKNANSLKRHLGRHGIEPEACQKIAQIVYGPIFPYWHSVPTRHSEFDETRSRVAALERKLWMEAFEAGNTMLNRKPAGSDLYDENKWDEVRVAFASHLGLSI